MSILDGAEISDLFVKPFVSTLGWGLLHPSLIISRIKRINIEIEEPIYRPVLAYLMIRKIQQQKKKRWGTINLSNKYVCACEIF